MTNLKVFMFVPVLLFYLLVSIVNAEMSSTNYRITSTVTSGGGGMMASARYVLMSTVGQACTPGNTLSDNYNIYSGFWHTMLVTAVGDVNGDGDVDLEDVIAALQIVTGQSPAAIMKEADADGDGKIGLSEALHILRKLGQ